MTISSEQNRVDYAGNGATVAFAVPFRFLANVDLAVALVDDATGDATMQTIVTHYTVSGSGEGAGGTVTFVTAPATGKTVLIWGDPPLTQLVDYTAGGPLPAESHEEALDRSTLQQKRTREIASRALHIPDGDPDTVTTEIPNKVDRASMLLGFDANGDPSLYDTSGEAALTADRALISNGSGAIAASSVSSTELGYLSGVTSSVQDQLDGLSGGGVTVDGEGLALTGSELSVELDGTTLSKSATGLRLAQTVVDTIDGKAATAHVHAAADLTSGTLADARVAESNVTQHEAALSIATSQLTGTLPDARVAESNVTQHEAAIDHDALANFVAAEHIDWSATGAEDIHLDRLANIANANIAAAAAIALSKLAALTASRAVEINASGVLVASAVTATELNYLDGVTSAIQTQLGTKLTTGTAALVNADVNAAAAIALSKLAALTASRALVSDGSGVVTPSAVTAAELAHVGGVTAAIQTQLGVARQYMISFSVAGDLTTGNGKALIVPVPIAGTITAGRAYAITAPTGDDIDLQVHNVTDAVDVFTGSLTIAASANLGSSTSIANGTLAVNDLLRLDIDTVGSGTAGADLVVVLTVAT